MVSAQFKIGVVTDLISMDLGSVLKAVNEMKLNHVEIHSLWNKTIEDLSGPEIEETKSLLKQTNLKVSNLSSTLFLMCPLVDEKKPKDLDIDFITIRGSYSKHLNYLKNCFKLCKEFKTNIIRIFGFREQENLELPADIILEKVAERLEKSVQLAENAGITLALENCPYTHLPTGILAHKVVRKIDSHALKLVWDPGNTLKAGMDPLSEYPLIKDDIVHIHVKNLTKNEKGVPIGKGIINYSKLLGKLVEDNYQGVISLEPEYALEGSKEKAVRKDLKDLKWILSLLNDK